MLGNLDIQFALTAPLEGGQSSDGNYYKYWDSIGGLYTIGIGFTDAVFPNSVFQSMPDVMNAEQAKIIFGERVPGYQGFGTYFTNIGSMGLTAHQIAVLTDIAWQWGNAVWSVRGYDPNYTSSDQLFNAWSNDSGMAQYASRHQTRIDYWGAPDPGGTTPTPPKTENKPKEKTKPKETPQKKNTPAQKAKPKQKNQVVLDGGTFYLRNTQLWHMGKHNNLMTRTQDHLTLNIKKKTVAKAKDDNKGTSSKNNNTNKNNTGDKKPSKPADPAQPSNGSANVEKFINKLASVPLRSLSYALARPWGDPNQTGWSDCSGYILWGLIDLLPDITQFGYGNTGTIQPYFQAKGQVIAGGSIQDVMNASPRRGDILNMGDDASASAGPNSHVVAFIDGENVIGCGYTPCPNIENAVANYTGAHPYNYLIRPFP